MVGPELVDGLEDVHGRLGEVAAFAGVSFVVLFDEDPASEAQQHGRVGEYPDDVGAAFDFLIEPLGFVDQIWRLRPGLRSDPQHLMMLVGCSFLA